MSEEELDRMFSLTLKSSCYSLGNLHSRPQESCCSHSIFSQEKDASYRTVFYLLPYGVSAQKRNMGSFGFFFYYFIIFFLEEFILS